jgi:glycine dehydrogenase
MIEPTESEGRDELDRFCDAMLAIRAEIQAVIDGTVDPKDNVLKHAPHTAACVAATGWDRPYPREVAVFPVKQVEFRKYWPPVGRVDNVHGDRNLFCSCVPISAWE